MKTYKYEEWDFVCLEDNPYADMSDRIYVDLEGNPITGILEEFKSYGKVWLKANPYETNSVIVKDGKYGL